MVGRALCSVENIGHKTFEKNLSVCGGTLPFTIHYFFDLRFKEMDIN